jgi:hypothetical protein
MRDCRWLASLGAGSSTSWRLVEQTPAEAAEPLGLKSNRRDPESGAFAPLRPEQRRSLTWMLAQELPLGFEEEEVEEEVGLGWQLEARASRNIVARGGVLADQVGYGKTVITIGLITAAPPIPVPPTTQRIPTKATLVFAPAHLLDQWPSEVQGFNPRLKVVVVKTMATLGALTVAQVQAADVVIVAISVLRSDLYFERMLALAGEHLVATTKAAHYFDQFYAAAVSKLEARVGRVCSSRQGRPQCRRCSSRRSGSSVPRSSPSPSPPSPPRRPSWWATPVGSRASEMCDRKNARVPGRLPVPAVTLRVVCEPVWVLIEVGLWLPNCLCLSLAS